MTTITVVICDDHTIVREGLHRLFEASGDIQVLGEAQDGHQAVEEVKRLQPNMAILDLGMPRLNGFSASERITTMSPATKVLILSSYCDCQHLEQAIGAGARGYVLKESASEELIHAVREVHRGNAFFSPPVLRLLLKLRQKAALDRSEESANVVRLSWREKEVLQLVAEGFATKQIAGLLSIANKTADKHRQAVMDKLNIHKVADLTRYAVAAGIVECQRPPAPVEEAIAAQAVA